ncbi:hypothetical protein GQ44DRAFT_764528 [Phaeosphaeriaceae sp. PMI808]|nr:hypothetical protein GQ44DRAFT_764528 [Phaeosphaeriaceae sp. PMI808]
MFSHLNLPREQVVAVTPPPPGVVPNFIDPSSIKHILINTNIILSLISAAFVALRLYTIIIITHNIGSDDCTRYGLGLHLWDVPFTTFSPNAGKVRMPISLLVWSFEFHAARL